MIIWLNGTFCSGKTQTADELHRRIPHSYVFDPENAGYYIRDNIPAEMSKNDFQSHPLWRELAYSMLRYIDSEYDGTIIVPMTLVDPDYFMEIVGRLRSEGREVRHFTLSASPETLLSRLESRGEGRDSWAAVQMDRCLTGLKNKVFECYVDTEQKSIPEVAGIIISLLKTGE
ncbi:AAA family ATPase [Paenibacillus borealis]|uniref:Tunicamycin resistance protein n=1 Tax=Paenibacillus borealis TaxID=160799 RepID=A0A089MVK0_PAEBO|nr:AAA family ATPase [Paenibacillus borealis]AIQ60434.1 Tunicamycin resistance protein [Paenibacillus borealis]